MTRIAMSPRERRLVIVGSTAIALIVVLGRGIPAWRAWVRDARAGAAEQMRAAATADALLAGTRGRQDTLAVRQARYLALAPSLVPGTTTGQASAALASFVSSSAAAAGVKLGAVQIRPAADTGHGHAFARVSVHADLVGDVRGLAALLLALERGPLGLRVRELTVNQAAPSAPTDRAEALHADLVVDGLVLIQ